MVAKSFSANNLVWIDLEGTGNDVKSAEILEISLVITNDRLLPLNKGLNIVIHQPASVLRSMNDWCQEHHTKSGLVEQVKKSKIKYSQAEKEILTEIQKYIPIHKSPLCGNSIFYDKSLLLRCLPKITDYLHYRIIDVSSLKELYRRWFPKLPEFAKKKGHRALDDIFESIAELKYYRQTILKKHA